jgi:hypothetical protein
MSGILLGVKPETEFFGFPYETLLLVCAKKVGTLQVVMLINVDFNCYIFVQIHRMWS